MPAKWTTGLLIILLAVLTVTSGYNYLTKPFASRDFLNSAELDVPQSSPDPTPIPTPIVVADIVATMTPEEKIAQVLIVPLSQAGNTESENASQSAQSTQRSATQSAGVSLDSANLLSTTQQKTTSSAVNSTIIPGGYLLVDNGLSSAEVAALLEQPDVRGPISQAGHFKPLIMVDHEGGTVQRLTGEGFSQLPSWQELCAMPKAQRTSLLTQSALELADAHIDMVLAPVLDRSEDNKVLNSRICAADTTLIALAAGDYVRTFEQAGVQPVFKHFPGIGQTTYDLHTRFDRISVNSEDAGLFRSLMDTFSQVPVMVSHVGVENQFADVPCSLSPACVTEILTIFPDRLIITDALDMASVRYQKSGGRRSLPDVARDAIAAGNSMLLLGQKVSATELTAITQTLLAEYQTNATFATKVDSAVEKVLTTKLAK